MRVTNIQTILVPKQFVQAYQPKDETHPMLIIIINIKTPATTPFNKNTSII